MEKCSIIFQPSGCRGKVAKGRTVLEAAREVGENLESFCGGKGICKKCKVLIAEGHFPKYGVRSSCNHLSPLKKSETRIFNKKQQSKGYRLACCAKIRGDVIVFVQEESRASKQVVSKYPRQIITEYNPIVKKYNLTLKPPSDTDPLADMERLLAALEKQHGLMGLSYGVDVLRTLPKQLRDQRWNITVSIWLDREIIRVVPGKDTNIYGVAVDIGTTTVAASLMHLNSMQILNTQYIMNPQIKYGEDVLSRISYHKNNKGGLIQMSTDIIRALNGMINGMIASTWPDDETVESKKSKNRDGNGSQKNIVESDPELLYLKSEDIEDITIVCNTIMHHILLQIDPQYVAFSPFPSAVQKSLDIKASSMGINVCPSAYVHILPNEAGFVGADNVGVIVAEAPHKSDQVQLIIDIGTNGELVLGNKKRLLSTSCATGPAFEGAQIAFGMRATPGAIERIEIDPETLEVLYKVVGNDTWSIYAKPGDLGTCGICGSGIIDVLAELYKANIITKTGAFRKKLKSPRYRINSETQQHEFVIAWAKESALGRDITITQKDIRQIQLAKAAIYTGCKLLMREWGTERVDLVKIAGGFGLHVDPIKILIMGMIPDCNPERIIAVGNSAGAGARAALLNWEKREEANWIAQNVKNIQLSRNARFKEEFLDAMYIPHKKDPFPHLESILPPEILHQK